MGSLLSLGLCIICSFYPEDCTPTSSLGSTFQSCSNQIISSSEKFTLTITPITSQPSFTFLILHYSEHLLVLKTVFTCLLSMLSPLEYIIIKVRDSIFFQMNHQQKNSTQHIVKVIKYLSPMTEGGRCAQIIPILEER